MVQVVSKSKFKKMLMGASYKQFSFSYCQAEAAKCHFSLLTPAPETFFSVATPNLGGRIVFYLLCPEPHVSGCRWRMNHLRRSFLVAGNDARTSQMDGSAAESEEGAASGANGGVVAGAGAGVGAMRLLAGAHARVVPRRRPPQARSRPGDGRPPGVCGADGL